MRTNPAPARRLAALAALAAAAALGATACSAPGPGTPASPPGAPSVPSSTTVDAGMPMGTPGAASAVTIHVHGFAYSDPGPVPPGATVSVMNMDPEAHTVTADDGSFNAVVGAGQTVSFTAPGKPGAYPYHCQYHSSMHATLTVK